MLIASDIYPGAARRMGKEVIFTQKAPRALGPYSQALRISELVFLSGQIGIKPETNELPEGFLLQAHQCFRNLESIARAAGGTLSDIVKLTIYLTDLDNFSLLNEVMAQYFTEPFPARAVVGVASLPRNSMIEIEGLMVLSS